MGAVSSAEPLDDVRLQLQLQCLRHHHDSLSGSQQGNKEKDLAGQKLKVLPQTLLDHGEDTLKVDLQRNRLKQVSEISRLANLRELNLSRNELVEFPQEMKALHHLETLYMNQNNIKSIPENVLPSLEKLQFLKLSTNRLAKLPMDLSKCKNLRYLNLSNNCLKDLEALVGLTQLQDLYVDKNKLVDLPALLFQNTDLAVFKANGNPLQKPPEEVCAGGLRDIRSYFAMLGDSSMSVCTIKTMFLGSSMAGKSTLCRSLKQGQPVGVDVDDRTVGIEISKVDKDNIRFLFWDFAGQEEYYLTHHVFITPHAFVILAIDLESYCVADPQSFDEKVSFWINNIQLRVPDSVVLLVGTHIDQCTDEIEVSEKKRDIEEKVKKMLLDRREVLELRKRNYQDAEEPLQFSEQMSEIDRLTEYNLKVLDLIPIDCTKSEDINKFQARILYEVSNRETFPNVERTLPKCYLEVELAIENHEDIPQHGMVLLDDLLNILDLNELDHEKLRCILGYLHRIGVILWYKEIQLLENMVFVKPWFLISLFKTIVRHDLVKQLEEIPRNMLQQERSLLKHRDRWVLDLKEKATLPNAAIRILVRQELVKWALDDKDLVEEVVGAKKKPGNLLSLLQHFEVCLPSKLRSPLNPEAQEFCPGAQAHPARTWESSTMSVYDPGDACLFPRYLSNNNEVRKKWGKDKISDLNIHVYFLPEIPHGFFHRLIIKTCSFYPTHWVGQDQCLFSSGNKLVLLKEESKDDGDPYFEIRFKEPERNEIPKAWDMIMAIKKKLDQLTQQWPGLCHYVQTPCKEHGCSDYFEWGDLQDFSSIVQEEKLLCRNGHTRRTELLFPKGATKSDT